MTLLNDGCDLLPPLDQCIKLPLLRFPFGLNLIPTSKLICDLGLLLRGLRLLFLSFGLVLPSDLRLPFVFGGAFLIFRRASLVIRCSFGRCSRGRSVIRQLIASSKSHQENCQTQLR